MANIQPKLVNINVHVSDSIGVEKAVRELVTVINKSRMVDRITINVSGVPANKPEPEPEAGADLL